MNDLNKVQCAALDLIKADAQYIYTLVELMKNSKYPDGNYLLMSLPYIGIFTHEAEEWGKKVGLKPPNLTKEEKNFYKAMRESHKLFDMEYISLKEKLNTNLNKIDKYFFDNRNLAAKIFGYYNCGADLINGKFCGNTILCATYNPMFDFEKNIGLYMEQLSVISGRLVGYYGIIDMPKRSLTIDESNKISIKDYHFYKNTPLKNNTADSLVLFSILCSINFCIYFIDNIFVEETSVKFKFAYLQYYYLCEKLIPELNGHSTYKISINKDICNRKLRNCIAHYGLQQVISEQEILDDPMKGLTVKLLGLNYTDAKEQLYSNLKDVEMQISKSILKTEVRRK